MLVAISVPPVSAQAATTVAAAGDIACRPGLRPRLGSCRQARTAALVAARRRIKAVLPLGDEQYPTGGLADFRASYGRTWGRVLRKSRPVPGNHEYFSPRANGYFRYFGRRAGPRSRGWYSYSVGRWHIIALNSNCDGVGGCGRRAPETRWLRADLASHHPRCTLVYWHHARFSSALDHGNLSDYGTWWRILYKHGADVVLGGHDHVYERFALQTPHQRHDRRRGIREFVVGTGGVGLARFGRPTKNLQYRQNKHFGVLKLTLHHRRYDWRFVTAGRRVLDHGSTRCH